MDTSLDDRFSLTPSGHRRTNELFLPCLCTVYCSTVTTYRSSTVLCTVHCGTVPTYRSSTVLVGNRYTRERDTNLVYSTTRKPGYPSHTPKLEDFSLPSGRSRYPSRFRRECRICGQCRPVGPRWKSLPRPRPDLEGGYLGSLGPPPNQVSRNVGPPDPSDIANDPTLPPSSVVGLGRLSSRTHTRGVLSSPGRLVLQVCVFVGTTLFTLGILPRREGSVDSRLLPKVN